MTFVSSEFLPFLVVVFVLFFTLPKKWQIPFLLGASYFFFGVWSVKYLCLLIFTMAFDYFIALGIDRTGPEKNRKRLLVLSLSINLGVLFLFKYLGLFSQVAEALSGRSFHLDLILPFGISFYTFHAMSYVIYVYRR